MHQVMNRINTLKVDSFKHGNEKYDTAEISYKNRSIKPIKNNLLIELHLIKVT